MTKSIVQSTKSKNFTFRITPDLSDALTEAQSKCKSLGLRVNLTEALTAALEREVKALQKEITKRDPKWTPGQLSLLDEPKKAHTGAQSLDVPKFGENG